MPGNDPSVDDHLRKLAAGEDGAMERLVPLVYDDLRRMAQAIQGRPEHSLNPTALVHEAYARLVRPGTGSAYENKRHFMNVAAVAMRQLLADHARERRAEKRGGGVAQLTLPTGDLLGTEETVDLVSLDDALSDLATHHPRPAKVVELRFLAGLSVEEAAEALGVSTRTVKLDWKLARAWLSRTLRGPQD